MFSKARTTQLLKLAKRQPAKFWGRLKKQLKRVGIQSKAEWHEYCKGLYIGEAFERRGSDQWRAETMDGEDLAGRRAKAMRLNECITEAQVVEAIKSMKRRKAADVLGFRAELLQAEVEELASTLTVLFNKMWRSGEFPKEWNEGVLVPIHKKPGTWENVQSIGLSLLG
jgi:hypothetical protein